ncbi:MULTISPECIES: response regulator transcription factor [Acidobacterium]|uniref:Two-component system regulatory protein n=1 Tax=Acidobacterium capsulatum (strain ATCC 51196 / DSM 11244 / BCRC 80197 / JCM 7670 / NBRC 15755 / NCIMB 13165 / 161) TaxID=240015 RepID=C1F5F0_ACIC5|nr:MULTISPECIES: response regulator transcription factor [Acidobacterium]ACO32302.1 two-component system regulatory protein [Acidobacterium capsulatum ATCC 51196]
MSMDTAGTPRRIRVLIVDDHPMVRDGVSASIRGQSDMELCGEAETAEAAIELFKELKPDITLMDLRLPGASGVEAIAQIRSHFPAARIIVLTTYQGDVQALRALRAGASGYLLKTSMRRDLLDTIRSVHSGRKVIPPEIATAMAIYVSNDELSKRELEILRQVAAGLPNKLIAERLSISPDTVKSHIANILSKLGANDRTHAVTLAVRRGYFDLDA